MTYEYVQLSDRAIRQVWCLSTDIRFFSHMKGAKFRLRQTTLSDTTVDCQHIEMHLCVCFPSGFCFQSKSVSD